MAKELFTILTKVGLNAITQAVETGEKIVFKQLAVGDGGGVEPTITDEMTSLTNEVWRGDIESVVVNEDKKEWIRLTGYIPASEGGFTIREIGAYDDKGRLIAVGSYPVIWKPEEFDGAVTELTIRMVIGVSNAEAVQVKFDESAQFITLKELNEAIASIDLSPIENKLDELEAKKADKKDLSPIENKLDELEAKKADRKDLELSNEAQQAIINELMAKMSGNMVATVRVDKSGSFSQSEMSLSLGSAVYEVAVDSQGFVYSASSDGTVRKISPQGSEVWSFTGHTDSVYAVAVDSQGFIYSGSADGTVRKISPDGKQVWSFTGHTNWVQSVAVDSQGFIYSGSDDKTVRKISPQGEEIWTFTGHTNTVRSVAVDSQGFVYSGSTDKTVRKISPDGKQVWSFTGHTNWVRSVAVDSQGFVYSGGNDNAVRKISPDGEEVWSFTGHTNYVRSVAVDSQGFIYSGSDDKTVRKISSEGKEIWSFTGHTDSVYAVAVDSQGFVYSGSIDQTVRKIASFYIKKTFIESVEYLGRK